MDRWIGKIAVVTGASSGIGAAITKDLVKAGVTVVGLARRQERIEDLKKDLPQTATGKLYSFKCDLSKEEDITKAFDWVEKQFGGVDILINNAGVVPKTNLLDQENVDKIKNGIDVNVLAVVLCTQRAFHSMKNRGVDGHIVIINSVAGHSVTYLVGQLPSFNIYFSTKHAITAMTEVLRQEFQAFKTNIKITSISPGMVKTEIFNKELWEIVQHLPLLEPEDISNGVLFALGTKPHVQVHELTIKPQGEPF